jgi:hypothetical protein
VSGEHVSEDFMDLSQDRQRDDGGDGDDDDDDDDDSLCS